MKSYRMKMVITILMSGIVCLLKPVHSMEAKSLKRELGNAYSEKTRRSGTEVHFCPDNTCDVILFPSSVKREVAEDFERLYFANASEYSILKQFQEENKASTRLIVERYRTLCADVKPVTPLCVLKGMAKKYTIKVKSMRFDEGVEAPMPNPLDNTNNVGY